MPDAWQKQCDMYLDMLKAIAEGDLPLPLDFSSLPKSTTENQEKAFTRSKFDKDGNRLNEDETGTLDVV